MSISISMKKLLFTACMVLGVSTAWANDVEFTVHHAPGGPSDRTTRLIAQELPAKNYVVMNRPGASGKIAMKQLMSRPSMMVATMPQIFVTNPLMFADLEYNPDRDLELIAVIGAMPSVLVCNNRHNFKTFEDVKNYKKPLTFGFAGYGSSEHIATAVLLSQWSNNHLPIPYAQGGATSLTDLLGGNIDCMFANFPLVAGQIGDTSRITPVMSSHELGLGIATWEQTFRQPYPVQSHLGLIVNRNLDSKIKEQIRQDVAVAIRRVGFDQDIRKLGLFPILKMDPVSIKESLAIHQRLRDFVVRNQLKLN